MIYLLVIYIAGLIFGIVTTGIDLVTGRETWYSLLKDVEAKSYKAKMFYFILQFLIWPILLLILIVDEIQVIFRKK